MLNIDSVTLSFSGKSVLSGCYLSCRPGEIVGLLGRNGSGKSSLLKIIFGSLKADFKHLRIDDKIVNRAFKSQEVAYLPQDSFFPSFLKVPDVLPKIRRSLIAGTGIERILDSCKDKTVGDLSGGELKMLETSWIVSRPATYILLDEPFMGVSPIHVEMLQELIRRAAVTKAVVLTDHNYRPLMEVSTRILLLHNQAVYPIREEAELVRYQYIPDFR
ncbi:ATP-binding cassette domain-containing protein [Hufsiella ginkgonis]|uniref:ATP-binding cassette domain-containing protein n=1 Tax=Hufsiella ginkgonis TaxID=2695274 RepID=A0A7K1Y084_9SPHI|nr:ATP-binding cassette domain-containing protein [Hufsiella ginkgonis]MXV16419.1 ATP-binding cassette domain-containing protein [Hufsiella ginkgonis]